MDYLKIIKGLLSKAYKFDDGKIAELLKEADGVNEENILSSLLTEDAARVTILKTPKSGETYNDGYAKAKKEVLTDLENQIKTAHGIQSDKKGVELIDEIITAKSSNGGKDGEITDDVVKRHPAFIQMEKDFKKQVSDKEKELETKTKEYETSISKISTFTNVKSKADGIFQALKPILPKNAKVAQNIKNQFYKELEGYDFEQQADGSYLVSKDGKRLEDGHGHSRDFNEFVESIAGIYFEFEENNGGANAGNNNDKDKTKPDIKNVKSESDATKIALDKTIPLADRLKALEDYEKTQG